MKATQKGRGFTVAALALALGAAVYLNWSFAKDAPQAVELQPTTTEEQSADAVQAAVPAEESVAVFDPLEAEGEETASTANKNYGEAQLVSVSKDSGSEFFEAARLSRSKARNEALDAIKDTLKNADLSEEEKTELTDKLQAQVNNITAESSLETVIKSKGFADCVVTLEGSKVHVTVMTENDALSADEVTQIRDAVLGQLSGIQPQDITVVEVK